MRPQHTTNTIRSEGALLPGDLLHRIQANDSSLPGMKATSYHLPGGMRLNEATSRAWNALLGAWATFQTAKASLPTDDPGTTVTRERWLLQLFQELNYGRLPTKKAVHVAGKDYPISHAYNHVPIHLVGCNVSLDKRTSGVAGAASTSPHSLVQEFLNRNDNSLWGIVSNGLRLRVLRDSVSLTRQSYLEFDLEAMMEGEVYADFVLLYLILHQSRVEAEKPENTYLEQWSQEAAETGTRALESLRDGVERAIKTLGQGFLYSNLNSELKQKLRNGELSTQDYYRQILRLVYRLLFLFVAEDRNLLHVEDTTTAEQRKRYEYYSTQRLREVSASIPGSRHGDMYESLKTIMRLLGNGGAESLGLTEMGGFLFSAESTPDLYRATLPNSFLLRAVRALAYAETEGVRRPVDYKNLGSEELGSVYESLLELHPEININTEQFILTTAAGNERKTTGSYYTPTSLINLLLDSALDPVVDDAVRGKTREEAEAAILNLKVVDPAVGSGHFLIAAAQRMAKRLAAIRTGDEEPAPDAIRTALREVISSCIYGVDINEMAAELCKVALWMEALEPGKPLTFLEHRIQVGNSLFGTTRKLVKQGIPNEAFAVLEGDDRAFANGVRARNRSELRGETFLFNDNRNNPHNVLADAFIDVAKMPTDTPEQVKQKARAYEQLMKDEQLAKDKLLYDAWCAAFVWPLNEDAAAPITTSTIIQLRSGNGLAPNQVDEIQRLANENGMFHWELAFPEVFKQHGDGFDVVLGNPPWERVKIQEKEWFASRDPEIASARNASERGKLIKQLARANSPIFDAFMADKRRADGFSHYARNSQRYALTGRGDLNLYPVFAELGRLIIGSTGRSGMVVPSGIATDDTTKFFFQDIMEQQSLVSLYDFENREKIFPGVDSRIKFCLLTLTGTSKPASEAQFVFFAQNITDVQDPEKQFTLTAEEIALLNPNTRTCPTFRTNRDAEITKAIYRRVPVLINEETGSNPWDVSFMRMFDMSNDSGLFRTREQLEQQGLELQKNQFGENDETYLPLYEGKMIHQFDHRYSSYKDLQTAVDAKRVDKMSNSYISMPRYWVHYEEFEERVGGLEPHIEAKPDVNPRILLGFRDVTRATDFRTAILSFIPPTAVGHTLPLVFSPLSARKLRLFTANFNSFIFDYCARQKLGGIHLTYFILRQLPMLTLSAYSDQTIYFINQRVIELVYTSEDLSGFPDEIDTQDRPFVWDNDRRFWLRAELDALYFHLYEIERDDADYIMETFPIVKRHDMAEHGTYRTKEAILQIYDEMARCKAEGREYESVLDPPPAHPSLTHPVNV